MMMNTAQTSVSSLAVALDSTMDFEYRPVKYSVGEVHCDTLRYTAVHSSNMCTVVHYSAKARWVQYIAIHFLESVTMHERGVACVVKYPLGAVHWLMADVVAGVCVSIMTGCLHSCMA
jgi:hypothetical protein